MDISFQLYSARNFPPVEAQLDFLAATGFRSIEPYGGAYAGDAAGFRKKMDTLGLKCPTAHVPLDALDADRGQVVGLAQTLGLETVVIPIVRGEKRPNDVSGWKSFASRLGEHAAVLAEHRLKLAWHNHDFEFAVLSDGSRPIDHLARAENIAFEADVGWIFRSDNDPVAEIGKISAKIAAVHVKDVAPAGTVEEGGWADLGYGVIDWNEVMPAILATPATVLVLEHDDPSDWQRFAKRSLDYLNGLLGSARKSWV